MAVARGKFSQYTQRYALGIEQLLLRYIRQSLVEGYKALHEATKQDSSNAAYAWQVIAYDENNRPVGRRPDISRDRRGRPPVGERGDHGAASDRVLDAKLTQEMAYIQKVAVGRGGARRFVFFNPILQNSGSDSDSEKYATNAQLKAALDVANERINERIRAYMLRATRRI